jgi:acetylornithine/N-succinyldiaminopimelate aminotransferase
LAATGQPTKQRPFQPLPPGFVYVDFGDISSMETALSDPQVVAVMIEIVQGEGGVVDAPGAYFQSLERLCKAKDILLIVDEVQTGMGRTGALFAFSHFGLDPDIVTLSKALGNGFPIGATWAKAEVANHFIPGDHGSTFGGSPTSAAAALAVFAEIDRLDLLSQVREISSYLREKLVGIEIVSKVSGMGLLLGMHLKQPVAKALVAKALEGGLVLNALSDRIIRVAPPLVISKREVDEACDVITKVSQGL